MYTKLLCKENARTRAISKLKHKGPALKMLSENNCICLSYFPILFNVLTILLQFKQRPCLLKTLTLKKTKRFRDISR